jgi:thiol:disulfide interchange protein
MKTLFAKWALSLGALCLTSSLSVAAAGWSEDYAKAVAQAKAENKLVVLNFTGSDWCPACIVLDREVFGKKEFEQYAKDHLVLVKVDFPQGKLQDKATIDQNEALQARYKVEGFPTVVVLNPDGKKIDETLGYDGKSASAFTAKLEALKKK